MFSSRIGPAVAVGAALAVLLAAGDASAQRRDRGSPTTADSTAALSARPSSAAPAMYGTDARFELVGYGAYRWTVSIDASVGSTRGEVDIADSGIWGIALDINVPPPNMQIRLAYDRQDSKFQYRTALPTVESDGSVEYLQIGTVKGVRRGNLLPFGLVTLGGTRYADDSGDEWKFSVVLGLGAKMYVSDKIGIIAQARMPYTFLSSGLGVGVGTGGVSAGITGWGLAQFDVGAGIMILL
jgi:hypothetical protein